MSAGSNFKRRSRQATNGGCSVRRAADAVNWASVSCCVDADTGEPIGSPCSRSLTSTAVRMDCVALQVECARRRIRGLARKVPDETARTRKTGVSRCKSNLMVAGVTAIQTFDRCDLFNVRCANSLAGHRLFGGRQQQRGPATDLFVGVSRSPLQ